MIKMTFTLDALVKKMDAAFKGEIEIADIGDSILSPQQLDQFVQTVESNNVLLSDARQIIMDEAKYNIDRIAVSDRVLYSGVDTSGDNRVVSEAEMRKPTFAMNQLVAQEFQTVWGVSDKMLRRIIGKQNATGVINNLMANASSRDIEELTLFGDTNITYATDDVLHQTDGWLKKAGNKVYGAGDDKDFDGTMAADDAPIDMFDAMMDELPKKYLENPDQYKFYVDYSVFDGYRDYLASRATVMGDDVLTKGILPPYKGIKVQYLPRLERSTVTTNNRAGKCALLTNPDNTVWGLFHEVTIEPDRQPKKRGTDFVLTLEVDAHYEDENGAVAAFRDLENPT
jgi:hypothetical protein